MNCMSKKSAILLSFAILWAGAGATTRYVSENGTGDGSSWAQASGDLQAMIDESAAGDEVWVSAGTYRPDKLIKSTKPTSKAFIMKDGVSIYGGFAGTETSLSDRAVGNAPYDMTNATVLSADDDVADSWVREIEAGSTYRWTWRTESNVVPGTKKNSTHVLYSGTTLTTQTVVDGFTLTGANANIAQAKPMGGAVYVPGKVALKNCRIVENSAYFTAEATDCNTYGGAVYLNGGSMENCYVAKAYSHSSYGNGLGGGVYAKNATITGCVFEDCVGLDGGGAVYLSGGTLKDCDFARCYSSSGGAVYNDGGTVENITITDCRGLRGGGVNNNGRLTNAMVRGCYADATEYGDTGGGTGGGIYNGSGDVAGCVVYNCTSWKGGGVYVAGGRLINATVLNNSVRNAEGGVNVMQDNENSVLNTIYDPATELSNFVSPTTFSGSASTDEQIALLGNADWSLAPGSAFIDSGTAVDGYTSGTDIAGNPRVYGASVDCGAYESQGSTRVPTVVLTFAPGTQAARLGLGGITGYEFTVDWGDGEEETYDQQAYYSHLITGNTVKVYGDEIVLVYGNSQDIVSADLSRASKLIQVQFNDNGMSSLTLGSHPSMTGLYASGNKVASVDVSRCPAMRVLDLHSNAIEGTIDCRQMASLSKVDISDNKVSSLLLPKHSSVYEIDCGYNKLTELDVTGLAGLDELTCSGNELTAIDLDGLTSLTELAVDDNKLTTIDVSPCTALERLMAAENAIETIDLSKNASLTGVYLQDNNLTAIDITANTSVRWLNIGNNSVDRLNVTAQPNLSILIAGNNKLTSIDLTANKSLSSLDLSANSLTSVDVSAASYLSQLHIENNAITALNLKNNSYLYGLFCANNQLTELDLSANTYLQRLEAQGNALTALDLSANTGLQEVLVNNNKLDEAALNAMIEDLPDVSSVEITESTQDFIRQLNISYMPGTSGADVDAATAKGWIVTAEYDKEEEVTPVSLNLQINRMGDTFVGAYNATFEYGNEAKTSLSIQDFMGTGARLVVSLDADGNAKVAPQVCGGDASGNFYMIVNAESTDGNPMAIYNTYVSGKFDGTTLTLEPWNFIIVPYSFSENLGTVYTENITTEFVKANGTMEYVTTGGATLTQNIYASVADDCVEVYGWGEYARIVLTKDNGMWSIDSHDVACTVDGKDYVVANSDGGDLVTVSVPDPRTLVFGAWQLKAVTGGTMLRDCTSATLHLSFDMPSGSVGVDDINADAEPVEVFYYNASGMRAAEPFVGFNVKVEVFGDGSRRTTKLMNGF